MLRVFVSENRFKLVVFVIIATFAVILGRLFYLQVWNHQQYQKIAQKNREKFEVIPSRRGNIVDAKGVLLAVTQATVNVGVDPQMVRIEDRPKIPQLARILGIDRTRIETAFDEKLDGSMQQAGIRPIRWRKLAEGVDEKTYERVLALKIKGVYGNRTYERKYPSGALAAHALGFINKEGEAVSGLERYMDFYLRGQQGWRESERDGRRREMAQFRTREIKANDGYHIELTLDVAIQHIVEEQLERIVEEYHPSSATIIVSEASTGFILGLGNLPSFNPNEFWKVKVDQHRNRAVTDVFEPGSSFKVVPASAALNESIINLNDMFDCSKAYAFFNGRKVPLPKDVGTHSEISVRDIITKSSNRGIAQVAMRLGSQRLYQYARAFGYGEKTDYGFDGEVTGILHEVKNWDGLTISRMPMGHALAATPMQVHYAMSVLANQGILMQPQLVRRIFDDEGNTVAEFKPKAKRRVISGATAKSISELLTRAVQPTGISRRAVVPGYSVAGKSGTTQKIIDGAYSHSKHVSSFVGFLPAERPRIVVTVVIDTPEYEGTAYGGIVAAPAFSRVAQQVVQYLGVPPHAEFQNHLAWKGEKYDWLR
tara:strand:+ start:48769 stop:50559 length:1791 start_codon:yes stop_codon:yes gene_type:complete